MMARRKGLEPGEQQALYRLADNLRIRRFITRMSQEELAGCAGIHRTQISLFESGQRQPQMLTLVRLSGALRITPNDLLDGMAWKPAHDGGAFEIADPEDWAKRLVGPRRAGS